MTTFADNFDRPDAATLGANWNDPSATFGISSNRCQVTTHAATGLANPVAAAATADQFSQLTIVDTNFTSFGVYVRGDGAGSFYLFRSNGTNLALFKFTPSAVQIGTPFTHTPVAGDVLRIEVSGSTITGYLNGVAVTSATNAEITTGSQYGMRISPSAGGTYANDYDGGDLAPAGNQAPTANAGPDQTVATGATVTLDGTASTDPDGTIASYAWTQTSGSAVTLSDATAAQPTFTAPGAADTLVFSLTVTDDGGATSAPDTVTINVSALALSTTRQAWSGTAWVAGHKRWSGTAWI